MNRNTYKFGPHIYVRGAPYTTLIGDPPAEVWFESINLAGWVNNIVSSPRTGHVTFDFKDDTGAIYRGRSPAP